MSIDATISGGLTNSKTAHIRFQDQEIKLSDATDPSNFPGLHEAENLHLYISTGDLTRSVCDVQDAMFTFFSHLRADHQLHTLDVHIDVSTSEDNFAGYEIVTSNYAERMFEQNIMREFRNIGPGDVSRPHITAFLTDPLRTIRNVGDGKKKGTVTLKYTGETGSPWKDIKTTVRDLVQSDQPVPKYDVFVPYFKHLRPILQATKWLVGTMSPKAQSQLEIIADNLATCRIRADLPSFHTSHKALVTFVGEIVDQRLDFSNALHYDNLQEREWKIREVMHLLPELESALPDEDTDVSFFGYNEIDAKLREWKDCGGERRAASKRKREEKEDGGGKKRGGGGSSGDRHGSRVV